MVDRYTKAPANQIEDRTLKQIELDITNTPSNGQILKVNMPLGDFTAIDAPSVVDLAASVAVNQTNIVLNAFRIAIDASRSIFNMVDGIVDYFNDETGIDTAASTNEDYDAANDLYKPTSAGGLDVSPFAHYKCNDDADNTVVTDDGTGANNGVANVNTSNYSVTGKINEAFEFNGTTEFINIDALLTDIKSDTIGSISCWLYRIGVDETFLSFGDANANNAFYLEWDGAGKVWVTMIADGVHSYSGRITEIALTTSTWYHLVVVQDGVEIKAYLNGTEQTPTWTNNNVLSDWFGKVGAALDTGRIGNKNYNSFGNINWFEGKLDDFRYYQNKALTQTEIDFLYNSGSGSEADQFPGSTDDMTLISDTFTAEAEPDDARIVVLLEDVDAITINTDLIAKISRDGGSNYSTVTLSDDGNFDASKRILTGSVDISGQPAGTSMEYKLETANNKDLKIHSAALNWE